MRSVFFAYHPIINFVFFCAVIGLSIFIMHPVFLIITLAASMTYSFMLVGRKMVRFFIVAMIPVMCIVTAINMFTNPRGATVICYTQNSQITFEAMIFGIVSGMLLASVILWFTCYSKVMTSDKLTLLFGRIMPSASMIFSMVMRFVPNYKTQIEKISQAQKCIGRDVSDGTLRQRIRHGIKIVSIMFTWALENSIDTADSMRSRGYGIKERSSFSVYRFDGRDLIAAIYILVTFAIVIFGAATGRCHVEFYPGIVMPEFDNISLLIYISYTLLCFMPVIIEVREEILWKYLQSKI